MKPYFVMPCYIATPELVELTTQAIKSMQPEAFIVAVDDGSPLNTDFLNNLADYTIHLKKNSGFGKACNAGFKWAIDKAEYIGCANNDIEVFPGWLEALQYPFSKWDDVGMTGLISNRVREIGGTPIEKYVIPKITSGGLLEDRMMSGGLWLSRREVLLDVGLFDEQFKVGGEEDVDLFIRVFIAGYKLVMSGHSCFWHKEGATRWNDEVAEGYRERNKLIEQTNYDKFAAKWGYDIRTQGLRFSEEVLE